MWLIPPCLWRDWCRGWHRFATSIVPWTIGRQPDDIERAEIAGIVDQLNRERGHSRS